MSSNNWKKVENESGYPVFIDNATGKQQYDHPEFVKIMKTTEEYDDIKYTAYRTAFKVYALQTHLKVPPLRLCSGVFARHQLSLSESSLSLDTAELEAVLGDIYFAAEKDGHFTGDVDLVVDLLINLLLNVFDKDRKEPVRVLAAKTLLICLSEDSISDKWTALANCCADHNGCVSPRRLASLLAHVAALAHYLGSVGDTIQADVDACFAQNAGMLGVASQSVAEWGAAECRSTQWLGAAGRVLASRQSTGAGVCACCSQTLVQVLKFQCMKCSEVYFCEKCYLYDKNLTTVNGHKKNHPIHEIVDGQPKPPVCLSFIKNMKRFFFCTKTKKRKTTKTKPHPDKEPNSVRRRKDKPAIFTSTVGKASGHKDSPALMLQDIITQLEVQNKVLQELASNLEDAEKCKEENLKDKVDAHWAQISTQISRLKILKDNLTASQVNLPTEVTDKAKHRQAFDLFSPIPIIDNKQSKINDNNANQPRVLSLDSGNFSVVSKNASQNLLTVSGDALKPVAGHATSDSISAVSVNDISSWYNDCPPAPAPAPGPAPPSQPADISQCERQYAADNAAVELGTSKIRDLNADLDTVLDRLHQILANNFAMDESCFDNTQLRETANEMEGLLGTLIRGVEQRATLNATKGLV